MPNNNAWLFLGPELGEKQNAINELIDRIGAHEKNTYYAGDTPVSVMVSDILNGSLFADKRLFLIKSAEGINKKEDLAILASCLASLPKDTFLFFISDETGVSKGLETLFLQANRRIFWELSDNRKLQWVKEFFTSENIRISADGIETILELVENNTALLRQECSRLIQFMDKTQFRNGTAEITGEYVEKWLSHTREESAFILFSRIAAGDLPRCLESCRMLLAAKESPPAIFAVLASCFRKLIAYLNLKEAGINDEFEYRKIGVSSPGAKRDYAAAARLYDSLSAEICLALTIEYDFLLRSSLSFPKHITMDRYLYKICSFSRKI